MAESVVGALKEASGYRDLMFNLTQRELRSRYRRSFLGWGWSLLQPAMMTAVYAIMLGYYLKVTPEAGDPSGIDVYAFFLLAGLLPFNYFSASLTTGMGTIVNAGGLMTRVWFPRLLLPMSSILALSVSLMIEMGILAVVVVAFTQEFMILALLPVAIVLVVLLVLFTMGSALFLTAANVRFRDVEYLTSVMLLAYFYLTPILYSPTFIPQKELPLIPLDLRQIALANPMARFAMAFRNVFYDVRLPGLPTMLWLVFWSVLAFYLGTRYFVRRSDRFAEMM
ncbi:MAG: ABC transporter permease [Ilumatobacter sp.]|nr:ABC transporter permease [Ilumatobacter sp.]